MSLHAHFQLRRANLVRALPWPGWHFTTAKVSVPGCVLERGGDPRLGLSCLFIKAACSIPGAAGKYLSDQERWHPSGRSCYKRAGSTVACSGSYRRGPSTAGAPSIFLPGRNAGQEQTREGDCGSPPAAPHLPGLLLYEGQARFWNCGHVEARESLVSP